LRLLAIETATETCSVALFDGDRLIGHAHAQVGRGHAERLIPMIAGLPDGGRAGRILVDCGPGSFTGVRVGLAAARALGFAWAAPVTGFSSLALLAAGAWPPDATELAAAIIGGHGEYFVQLFQGPPMHPLAAPASLPPDAAARLCGDRPIVGSGAAALVAAGAPGPALPGIADARDVRLLPAALTALPPVPRYGRAPDARLPA
jgi:tRNA threonylcarbamoyladenosine biosynthesis protein TsaB